jgi:prophage DNA circulation protein
MAYSDQLQTASYNGVPFGVENASIVVGRRVALHEYPFRDIPWSEDIGRATRKLQIKGFLISDPLLYRGGDVLTQRKALLGAVETKGAGQLIHPSLGQLTVSCLSVAVNERTDKGRYFEVEFTFYDSGERLFPSSATNTTGTTLEFADLADASSISDFVSRASQDLAYGAQVANEAVATAFKWGQPAITLVQDATNLAHLASVLPGSFGRYFAGANVGGLGLLGNTGNQIYSATVSVSSLISDATAARSLVEGAVHAFTTLAGQNKPNEFAASAQAVADAVRAACADPHDALRLLQYLAQTPQPQNQTDTSSPVSAATADMQRACNDLYRRAACVALARASSDYRPSSYDDALDKRDRVRDVLDQEILTAGDQGEDDCYQSLRELRRAVVADLTSRGATLAEMKTFVEPSPMPSLTIANQLYRDATRDSELVVQVNPIHPAFMPTTFRALAF